MNPPMKQRTWLSSMPSLHVEANALRACTTSSSSEPKKEEKNSTTGKMTDTSPRLYPYLFNQQGARHLGNKPPNVMNHQPPQCARQSMKLILGDTRFKPISLDLHIYACIASYPTPLHYMNKSIDPSHKTYMCQKPQNSARGRSWQIGTGNRWQQPRDNEEKKVTAGRMWGNERYAMTRSISTQHTGERWGKGVKSRGSGPKGTGQNGANLVVIELP